MWHRRSFQLGPSFGLIPVTSTDKGTAELLAHADVAFFAAKNAGCSRVRVYEDQGGSSERLAQIVRASDLRGAMDEYANSGTIVEALRQVGVDYAQGYVLGRPRPIAELSPDAPAAAPEAP